jgi:hypothetical protein
MSKKNLKKLLKAMTGKQKKKPVKKTSRIIALEGRKNFSKGSGENDMVRQAQRDYNGSYISGDLGGVEVGNPSYKKYYKGLI